MKTMKAWMRLRWVVASFGMALWLVACTTVPETGRTQLNLLSPQQARQMGQESFEQMKKELTISKDPELNALVQRVGNRIAEVAPLENAEWEFVVFESEQANAFCLPGGKVGVYTGILPITKNENGMATVLGHEVAHAVANHGAERVSQGLLAQTGASLLEAGFSNADPKTQQLIMGAFGIGVQVGVLLPYSRTQESEADHLGLLYMAEAGYDPEGAVAFWQRFSEWSKQQGGGGTPGFLRTHPVDEVRIERIKGWLPEANEIYRNQSGGGAS